MRYLFVATFVLAVPMTCLGDDAGKNDVDWSREIHLTAGGEAGNNENYSINLTGELGFTATKWRGDLVDLRVKDKVIRRDGESEEKKRDHSIYYDGDLKRSFGKGKLGTTLSWVWNDSKNEYDDISNYWDVGIGVNWQIYSGKKARFEFDTIGVTYRVDRERAESSISDVWGQLGSTLNYQFNEGASLEWESKISFNPEDDAHRRMKWSASPERVARFSICRLSRSPPGRTPHIRPRPSDGFPGLRRASAALSLPDPSKSAARAAH